MDKRNKILSILFSNDKDKKYIIDKLGDNVIESIYDTIETDDVIRNYIKKNNFSVIKPWIINCKSCNCEILIGYNLNDIYNVYEPLFSGITTVFKYNNTMCLECSNFCCCEYFKNDDIYANEIDKLEKIKNECKKDIFLYIMSCHLCDTVYCKEHNFTKNSNGDICNDCFELVSKLKKNRNFL